MGNKKKPHKNMQPKKLRKRKITLKLYYKQITITFYKKCPLKLCIQMYSNVFVKQLQILNDVKTANKNYHK